jgi:photosystem II stability/assembly factor-like uncharacterized protein
MSTDTERRLRAALQASAELITDPPGAAEYHPAAAAPPGRGRPPARRRRRLRWVAPPLAAAAVAVIALGASVIVHAVNTGHGPPVSHRSSPPSPAPSSAAPRGPQPLTGPGVAAAGVFADGAGYARTPHALLWTSDLGASWRDITPPGLTPAQFQAAGLAVRPGGQAWIAVPPRTGGSSVAVLRRSPAAGTWTSADIPLAGQDIPSDAAVVLTSVSFADATHGWLLVTRQVTHTGFSELLRTTDGGATWTAQAAQPALPAAAAVYFLTPTLGYLDANTAMGSRGWWVTRDAGHSWTKLRLPAPAAWKSDSLAIIGAPALAGGVIVVAASFSTPVQGQADGAAIYRSTDLGDTWTVRQLPRESPAEQYDFAASPDGSSYVLLREHPAGDSGPYTWVTSRSTDGGQTFTDTTSVHDFYPGPLTVAGLGVIWTVAGSDACPAPKASCQATTGLIASADGGATWHQLSLPS